ncbi:MAG: ribonuclease Z, partial [Euryarchaeota archaeon]|nr:ribonuclease Z [Euryarchaeota archaeon]
YVVKVLRVKHPVPTLAYCFREKDIPRIDRDKADALGLNSRVLEKLRKEGKIVFNGREITIDQVAGGVRRGRKIVYSGDTAPVPEMVEFARDADILIHEATADASLEEKANKYGHSTAQQAAQIAKESQVRKLVLVHISPRYRNPKKIIDEAREIFPNVHVPADLEEMLVKVRKD